MVKSEKSVKSARITFRVEPEIKDAAEKLFGNYGINTATALNMFLHRAVQENWVPFSIDGTAKSEDKSSDQ